MDEQQRLPSTANESSLSPDAEQSLQRRPALVFLSGDSIAAPIPLDRNDVTIGRALEADVRINDALASRLHARISTEFDSESGETQYRLLDLNSTNGTRLNGQRVAEAYLKDGDKIFIGERILRFDLLDEIDREFQQRIHRLLAHDELTGLLTSKSFFSELRREAVRAEREQLSYCVLMMDIDFFKQVNDRHGHLTGSQTLEQVGAIIMRELRAGDVAARFGGEEFAAFLLDATAEQGLVAAERVRAAIEEFAFPTTRRNTKLTDSTAPTAQHHHITISIGVAVAPDDSNDPLELVELADAALYRAKNAGRNCVAAYSRSTLSPHATTAETSPASSS